MLIDVIRIKAFFTDFALKLAFGTIVFVEVTVGSTTARTDQILRYIAFGMTFNWLYQVFVAILNIGNIKLIIEGNRGKNGRKLIYFEFLILRRMGIIKCPLLKRDVFADKEK